MGKTIVIGTTFVDFKGCPNDKYDPQGRNLGQIKIVHGGVGRNIVENFANVGMPVAYVGMLEETAIGRDVENRLREAGADLSYVIRVPENGIGMWLAVFDETGNLAGSVSRMPDTAPLVAYLREHAEEIVASAETVVLELDLNEEIAEMFVDLAIRYRKNIYSVVGNMSVILARKDLVRKTNCFICNEIEAAKYFGEDITGYAPERMMLYVPKAAIREGLQSMVVTMGARGAVYYDGVTKTSGFCPPCPAGVVDTTGAGDAFFSGTVMALNRGLSLAEAVKYGTRLAASTICREENNCPVNKSFFQN